MPTTFTFEEASQPSKSFTFEEAQADTEAQATADVQRRIAAEEEGTAAQLSTLATTTPVVPVAAKREALQPDIEAALEPIVHIPRAEPPKGPFPGQEPSTGEKVAAGAYNVAAGALESFTSPAAIATLGAGALVKPLAKLGVAGWTALMAKDIPKRVEDVNAALKTGDAQQLTESIGNLAVATGFTGLGLRETLRPAVTVPEVAAAKAPQTAEALAQTRTLEAATIKIPEELATKEPVPSTRAPETEVPSRAASEELAKPAEIAAEPPAVETVKAEEAPAQPETPSPPPEATHPILGLPESQFTEGKLQSLRMRNDLAWTKIARYFGVNDPARIAQMAKERFDALKKVGIAAPGGEAIESVSKSLSQSWEGLKTGIRTSPNKQEMAAHMDAAENAARIEGAQQGNAVKLEVPSELDRKAITFIIESKGDPANLESFMEKVMGNATATEAVRHAIDNYERLSPKAELVSQLMERQRLLEEANGLDTDFTEGYIKHAYDMDVMMGVNRPVILAQRGGGGISTAFKKQRVFETYADAIQAGYKPRTLDSAALVDSRVNAGMRLINRKKWGEALRDVVDPTSAKPIVTDMVTQPKGTQVAPSGYVPREILPGVRIAVQEGYQGIFDALTGPSRISEFEVKGIPVGRMALLTEARIKHGLLLFDTFHMSRIMQKELFLRGKVGWNKGLSLLEYSDADLASAVKQELITPDMADWVKSNRGSADLLIKEGLNVGAISEALYADVVKNIPLVGRFNRWVFQKMTRGAMMESALVELERVSKQHPEMSQKQIARKVAGDVNAYFGNLGRQGVFKSKTFQDLARLLFLAPQWVESMATTELKGFGQMARVPFDSARARQLQVGTLAKGTGQGLLAYFVATQLLNLATRGTPTWENPEKGHKLDAWIPDVTGHSDGFFLSPFSVPAELTHDMIRYSEAKASPLAAAGQIAKNKISPLSRAAATLLSQEDYSGTKIYGTWNVLKEAAWSLAPTPIPLSGPIKGQTYPGQAQRQALGSMGVKVEPSRKEFPLIVGRWHIASRQGFEEYLNSISRQARTMPEDQRMAYVLDRLREDEVAPRYREEAKRKLRYKLRQR